MAKMVLKCNECGKVFRVSDKNDDPQCPKCGGVDYEVEGVLVPKRKVVERDFGGAFDGFTVTSDADGGL